MRKLIVMLLALTISVGAVSAQDKKSKKTETVEFKTDLDCENCAKKILNVIPFKKGVKDCVVDVPTKSVKVTFDPRKTDAAKLEAELNKIDVHVVKPEECKGECAGTCVGEHTKTDACCGGDHNHSHDHNHDHAGHNH